MSASTSPLASPQHADLTTSGGRFRVDIFNNDETPIDIVIMVLMTATGCDVEEAKIETWEAHHFGKASVHFSSQAECERVAGVIERVGVDTAVLPEWDD